MTGEEVKCHEVARVLKDELGMRYRRIQNVPLYLNSRRNLILRQQWALKYLELVDRKIFLNVDESWLSESYFLRRKWRARGDNNSIP